VLSWMRHCSADKLAWLSERGYLYLVVSRERYVQDPRDQDHAILVRDTGQNTVSVFRTIRYRNQETRLYCYSDQKAKKEQAIRNRFHVRLEEALDKLNVGLDKKAPLKTTRKYMNASVDCAKKTAVSRKTTVLKSLP